MEFDVNVTLNDLLDYILPNIESIPGLINHIDGDTLLSEVKGSRKEILEKLQNDQDIIIHENKRDQESPENGKDIACTIERAGKEFIIRAVARKFKTVYILVNSSYSDVKHEQKSLNQYDVKLVRCSLQTLCHAYLNANLILRLIAGKSSNEIVDKISSHQHLINENAAQMLTYIILSRNEDIKEHSAPQIDDVNRYINDSVIQCKTLAETIQGLEMQLLHRCMDNSEKRFTESKYTERCIEEFMKEVQEYLTINVKQISEGPNVFTENLKHLHEISDISTPFSQLVHCPLVVDCAHSLNETKKEAFLQTLLSLCWKWLTDIFDCLKAEKDFLRAFELYSRECFINKEPLFTENINLTLDRESVIRWVLEDMTANLNNDKFSSLKVLIRNIKNKQSFSDQFSDRLVNMIKDFLTPTQGELKKWNDRPSLFFESSFIDLQSVGRNILNFSTETYEELVIFCSQILLANACLELPGKNIVIIVPEMVIHDNISFDVSGKHAIRHINAKARDGIKDGEDGQPGIHGENGDSGGNVLILADKILGSENLSIRTNGGNGADGQDGGCGKSGKKGVKGFGFTEEEFKDKFPRCSVEVGLRSHNQNKTISNIKVEKSKTILGDRMCHYEGVSNQGNEIQFGFYDGYWVYCQSYCFVKGADGSKGGAGGDGGCGGKGGLGGYAGSVQINGIDSSIRHSIKVEAYDGENGNKGNDGFGGKGGIDGEKGPDNARVDPSEFSESKYYHGYYKMTLSNNSNGAWCIKEKKYVDFELDIKTGGKKNNIKYKDGVRGAKKTEHMQEQRMKQRPVLRKEMIQLYKSTINTKGFIDVESSVLSKLRRDANNALMLKNGKINNDCKHTKMSYHKCPPILKRKKSNKFYLEPRKVVSMAVESFQPIQLESETYVDDADKIIRSCNEAVSFKEWCTRFKDLITRVNRELMYASRKIDHIELLANTLWQMKKMMTGQCEETTCFLELLDLLSFNRGVISDKLIGYIPSSKRERIVRFNKRLDEIRSDVIAKYKLSTMKTMRHDADRSACKWLKSNQERCGDMVALNRMIRIDVQRCCIERICQLLNLQSKAEIDKFVYDMNMSEEKEKFDNFCNCLTQPEKISVMFDVPMFSSEFDSSDDDYGSDSDSSLFDVDDDFGDTQSSVEKDPDDQNRYNEVETTPSDKSDRFADMPLGTSIKKTLVRNCITNDDSKAYKIERNDTLDNIAENKTGVLYKNSKSNVRDSHGKIDNFDANKFLYTLPENIQQLILKLQYVQVGESNRLIQILSERFTLEGILISDEVFQWIMTRTIHDIQTYGTTDMMIMFSTTDQKMWLLEYVILQLREKVHVSYQQEVELRENTEKFKDNNILLFLSQQLLLSNSEINLTTEDIVRILTLSSSIDIDEEIANQLRDLYIQDWSYRLHWFQCLFMVANVHADQEWEHNQLLEATYYFADIKKAQGDRISEQLIAVFDATKHITIQIIIQVLQQFKNGHWTLDDLAIDAMKRLPCNRWSTDLDKIYEPTKTHSLESLLKKMIDDPYSSVPHSDLEAVKKKVIDIKERLRTKSTISQSQKFIKDYGERDIQIWCDGFSRAENIPCQSQDANSQNEMISILNQAVFIKRKFYLRDTQLFAIAMFLHREGKGMLQQIATGEGKTLIIAVLAIFKALTGEHVDIITSSAVLAKRDADTNSDLFALFKIVVGHNCDDTVDKRKKVYTSCFVIYGEIGAFQRDLLLDDFYREDLGSCSRRRGSIIIDEVDSMLLDKGQNLLYLSHDLAGLDMLEHVYVYIWNFIHAKDLYGSEEDVRAVEKIMLSAMYGILRKEKIKEIVDENSGTSDMVDMIFVKLREENVIDDKDKIIPKEALLRNEKSINIPEICETMQKSILCHLKEILRAGIMIPVPNFLSRFVETHLRTWIGNAFKARYMAQNDNYIIDIDRSDDSQGTVANIIIIDKDTGVEQYNSSWSEGLHQFLQLKHSCKFSAESLKAVFISNVSYFKRYGHRVYGLSGTLGSVSERDYLKELYEVEYLTVPPFCASKFIEKMPKMCASEADWIKNITIIAKRITEEEQRPILIICESVKAVEKLEKAFDSNSVHVYKRSYIPLDVGTKEQLDKPIIILATNLAGRGTDIKISKKLNILGGLHICLTYLPTSIRVEQQAFGRAARKGQNGSAQLVCVCSDLLSHDTDQAFIQQKVERDREEEQRIGNLKGKYQKQTKKEEALFQRFEETYGRIVDKFKKIKELQLIVSEICLDKWALWLDGESRHSGSGFENADIESWISGLEMVALDSENALEELVESPAHCIKLAKYFVTDGNYDRALTLLNKVICEEELFAAAAHYYKGHVLIKKDPNSHESILKHMQKALFLINQQKDILSSCASMVSIIGDGYKINRESFLISDDYTMQKETLIDIYDTLSQSALNIVGQEISHTRLESHSINFIQASYIYNDLVEADIVKLPRWSSFSEEYLSCFRHEYQLCFSELVKMQKDDSSCSITQKSFKDIMPNREEFWKLLNKAGLLTKERKYVIVDKQKLQENIGEDFIVPGVINLFYEIEGVDDFKDVTLEESIFRHPNSNERKCKKLEQKDTVNSTRTVCFIPEQLDDISSKKLTVIRVEDFERKLGNIKKWKTLKERGIIMENKIGLLRALQTVPIDKYDTLSHCAFSEIDGVDECMSNDIYKALQTAGLISNDYPCAKLLKKDITPHDLNLPSYGHLKVEILNIFCKHFMYRIAFDELVNKGTFTLQFKQHVSLYQDLVLKGIITPAMVNGDLNKDGIMKKVKELYGSNGDIISLPQLNKFCDENSDVERFGLWDWLARNHWIRPLPSNAVEAFLDAPLAFDKTRFKRNIVGVLEAEVVFPGHDKQSCTTSDKDILPTLKIFLSCRSSLRENMESLVETIFSMKRGLRKFDVVTSELKDLTDQYDADTLFHRSEELRIFQNNGFNNTIILSEKKWTLACICKIAAIFTIGLAQIVAGIIIEVFSVGAATMLASGLIGEGVGDIMFAIECAFSGYCTWKAYAQHKIISVCVSVLTAGIGAFFSRGAQFSKFGYKLGGDFLNKISGKALVKEAGKTALKEAGEKSLEQAGKEVVKAGGKRAIMKRAGKETMKKVVEATALASANEGIDFLLTRLLKQKLKDISSEMVDGIKAKVEQNSELKSTIQAACKTIGVEKTQNQIENISRNTDDPFGEWHELVNKVTGTVVQFGNGVADGLSQATQKMSMAGNSNTKVKTIAFVAKTLKTVLEIAGYAKTVAEIYFTIDAYLENMKNKIKRQTERMNVSVTTSVTDTECSNLIKAVTLQWQGQLTEMIQEKITNELGKPLMQRVSNKIVSKSGSLIKKSYLKIQGHRIRYTWKNLKAEYHSNKEKVMSDDKSGKNATLQEVHTHYNRELTKLLAKTRDPRLFADIIREGVPVGIHCVQAVAEILNRPIKVKTMDGDDTVTIPKEFSPSGEHSDFDPIIINFHIEGDGTFGHFTNPHDSSRAKNGTGYDCLIEAISSQLLEKIDRNQIASEIETNPHIKSRIKKGIHKHFMGKGAIGGAVRSAGREEKICQAKQKFLQQRLVNLPLRDPAMKTTIAGTGTGNHEIFACSMFQDWLSRSKRANTKWEMRQGVYVDHYDAFFQIRVDTRYIMWRIGTEIYGHSGTLYGVKLKKSSPLLRKKAAGNVNLRQARKSYNQKEMFRGQKTKGQLAFHSGQSECVAYPSNVKDAIVHGLQYQLDNTIDVDGLNTLVIKDNCYTSTGHNLKNKQDRARFAKGLGRERCKIDLIRRAIKGENIRNAPQPKNYRGDSYIENVVKEICASRNIADYGRILMKPAPFE